MSACEVTAEQTVLHLQTCSETLSAAQMQDLNQPFGSIKQDGTWVRVYLRSHETAQKALLDIGIPDAFEITVFAVAGARIQKLMDLNEQSRFSDRPVQHRSLIVRLDLSLQTTVVYLHYRTHGKTPLLLRLYNEDAFRHRDTLSNLINGAIFGFLIVVIPLFVTVFQSVQNRHYKIYACLVVANLALLGQFEGYWFQFIWPDSPVWNMEAPGMLGLCMAFWHIVFAIRFLQLRERMLKLYFWHIASLWLIVATAIVHLLWWVEQFAMLLLLAYSGLALLSALLSVRQGLVAARFYLIGTLFQVVFVAVLLSISISVGNPFPQISVLSYPKIGYLGEAVFFAAAVWSQIRLFNERQTEMRLRRLAEAEQLLQAEQSKIQALEKARQQQMQLATASHDIAQPLASLRFALAALGQKPENKAVAEHVENTLNYAQSLLKELIVQTREEQVVMHEEIKVHELFQQLAQEFEGLAQQKGLRLAIHDSHFRLQGSAVLLYRILNNLLANAIRYTSKGRIVIGVRRRSNALEFQIWDTGPGIPQQTRAALLQAFAQGDGAQQSGQGYGLGLFIVNTLCRQCGYELKIFSEVGKGSGFCLVVPIFD